MRRIQSCATASTGRISNWIWSRYRRHTQSLKLQQFALSDMPFIKRSSSHWSYNISILLRWVSRRAGYRLNEKAYSDSDSKSTVSEAARTWITKFLKKLSQLWSKLIIFWQLSATDVLSMMLIHGTWEWQLCEDYNGIVGTGMGELEF